MELLEAHQIVFRGQSNVAVMAKSLDMSLEYFQASFREYVSKTPINPDIWKGDIEISWPYIT
jgi:hypothetical protein